MEYSDDTHTSSTPSMENEGENLGPNDYIPRIRIYSQMDNESYAFHIESTQLLDGQLINWFPVMDY